MFTGIVEQLAPVVSLEKAARKTATSIRINLGKLANGTKRGDSICINGVCLTATSKRRGIVSFDTIEETLRVTNLGKLATGSRVNIERSLRPNGRIGGHIVTGHIDKTGTITKIEKEVDGSLKMFIETDPGLLPLIVPKGSVAVDGVSLTVVDVTRNSFSVCLIPTTLTATTLGYKTKSDSVNIEADMIGKYVRRYLEETTSLARN
jgi:riboflavin synthase